jgi:transcription elongation factor Elf1
VEKEQIDFEKLAYAVFGGVAGFLLAKMTMESPPKEEKKESKEATPATDPKKDEPVIPKNATYHFKCFLCSGETKFSTSVPLEPKRYRVPCCRCGMDNVVEVAPPQKTAK